MGTSGDDVWLTAHDDPLASLYTFSSCICLADLSGDGDYKLIVADLGTGTSNMKLKVYKGTTLVNENTLLDLPTGVITFHMDTSQPKLPAVAVASGAYIYIYKNLRPYFKFTLPTLEVNSMEQDIWNQAADSKLDGTMVRELLDGLRQEIGEAALTSRSQRLLIIPPHDLQDFVDLHTTFPLKKQTVVTCVTTLKKSHAEEDAISCLVVGTESSNVYILDPEAFTILANVSIEGVPVHISASGLYDVEFRVVVSCRDGVIYVIRRGSTHAKSLVQPPALVISLCLTIKNVLVATMDNMLRCYSHQGKEMWSVKLSCGVMAMEVIELQQQGTSLLAVALDSKHLHLYLEKHLVYEFSTSDVITAMKFGRFGREDHTLVMITQGGGLIVKMLKRTAQFRVHESSSGPVNQNSFKLNIPKKTKLFVDQTMRERENPVGMHRVFQHDLYQLRLETARNYVKALESSATPISTNPSLPVRLTAQVLGLGPTFKIRIELTNTSNGQAVVSLAIAISYDTRLYSVDRNYIPVPILVPGLALVQETLVTCLSDSGLADDVCVFILRDKNPVPLLTALIKMPISEAIALV